MNREDSKTDPRAESNACDSVSLESTPPAALEDRIVKQLLSTGLISDTRLSGSRKFGRPNRIAIGWTAFAACSFLAGMWSGTLVGDRAPRNPPTAVDSPATTNPQSNDLYALLLVNSEGYEDATGTDQIARYSEYATWISSIQQRGLYVMGRELDAGSGWNVAPSTNNVVITESSIANAAPLSGIFLVRASDIEQALDLASQIPQIRHGGQVHVKKVAQLSDERARQ